jgi:type II secretory pathway pseudopilin PulG
MIELLVVIAILALLMILAMNNLPLFIARGQDSKRKSNLS